ncbi:transposase [Mesorhizobium sp. M1396]|uniref:transposase n=1 Tax=Mesorhizobium sp. M1396 TaxID=2957095 RepID=UPI0033371CFB
MTSPVAPGRVILSTPPDQCRSLIYKCRNRIERCFNKLKHFRRFATRYNHGARHLLSFIHLAAAMIWMR